MAGTVFVGDGTVVTPAHILVLDHEADRGAGGMALEDAGENAEKVGLPALRGVAALSRPPPVHPDLEILLGQRHARRTAIDHTADRRAMTFSPGGEAEKPPETIAGHSLPRTQASPGCFTRFQSLRLDA